jgi:GTP-binding protein
VALVGRPNVGKSALFNRIVGSRESIVHEESGVTRDRVERWTDWQGRLFRIVDTAGMNAPGQEDSSLPSQIQEQVRWAIEASDVLIQVVDVTAGVTPLDEMVAAYLRRSGKPVVVAVNKVDHPGRTDGELDFLRLGLDPLMSTSALHGGGVGDLLDWVVEHLPEEEQTEEVEDREPMETESEHEAAPGVHVEAGEEWDESEYSPEDEMEFGEEDDASEAEYVPPSRFIRPEGPLKLVVVGRPNAGKSSLINALVQDSRVLVSEEPCTTRDAIDVPLQIERKGQTLRYLLIDTAGLRRTAKITQPVEYYGSRRTQESLKRADLAFLVLDADQGITRQDQRIARMIADYGIGCVIVFNKSDLLKEPSRRRRLEGFLKRQLAFLSFAPNVLISAKYGRNLDKLLDAVERVSVEIDRQISTPELNRLFERAMQKYQAPMVFTGRQSKSSTGRYRQRPKVAKIYYATQVSTRPLRFRLFVNDRRAFSDNYLSYLTRFLRGELGLEGAPVFLHLSNRKRNEER